ncbi:MAG TPA: aminoacyl-tRNA hydrolase [Gemmatimonadaceae bacterium]|nr:aminoacyl-tRNA hydrolase [Gemmatimonadaceae bacterium]
MKVIVGLGNPGRAYARTRHNVGWWVADRLAEEWRFEGWRRDGHSVVASGRVGAIPVRLVKPQTYMNLSGAALVPYLRRPTFSAATDLFVIVDDVALPVGRFRLRARGSHGGHNGLRSIEQALGSREYARLRIGVAPDDPHRATGDLADFVLSDFGAQDRDTILALMPQFVAATETWLVDGIDRAMNAHNREPQQH